MIEHETVKMKDFAKYLNYSSFHEVLHHIRKISLERIVANEPLTDQRQPAINQQRLKTA
jgi:hypothetical protein